MAEERAEIRTDILSCIMAEEREREREQRSGLIAVVYYGGRRESRDQD